MLLNTTVISADAAFVISNLQSNNVLDLSETNEIDSTSSASEIIYRFDALTQLPDGLIMEEAINKCVEIHLLLGIRFSDLKRHISGRCSKSIQWPMPTPSKMCALQNMSVIQIHPRVRLSSVIILLSAGFYRRRRTTLPHISRCSLVILHFAQ
jgi:hypothetical protein